MRRCWWLVLLIAALGSTVMGLGGARAQDGPRLAIDIDPEAGAPGTPVAIVGTGAPPNAVVRILTAVWDSSIHCRIGRDAQLVAEVTADAAGQFSATHTAERVEENQAGYTYLAELVPAQASDADQSTSNIACFTFGAAPESRFFQETGHWVTGRFLEYWESNGALPVFGYPLTEDLVEQGRTAQYFERQRFEYHPQEERPYDVLLGLLGREVAKQRGLVDTEPFQPVAADSNTDCTFFPETRHRLCHGFRTYWDAHGLEFGDPGVSDRESVALFGYPISEEYTDPETGLVTQYFERARFEYHHDNPAPYRVLLGRLGAEVLHPHQVNRQPVGTVQINLVAVGDNGQSGMRIGCGDSLVPVEVEIPATWGTAAKIKAALGQLFAINERRYGESDLYNALYQSNLAVERVTVVGGIAKVHLTGTLQVDDACDELRVEQQVEQTVRQFAEVSGVIVHLSEARLYPDLRPLQPRDLQFDTITIGGTPHRVLRFTTRVLNTGDGVLELRGETRPDTGKTVVHQRFYDETGNLAAEHQVGEFVWHQAHDHWHLGDFTEHELWTKSEYEQWLASGRTSGEAERRGIKTSFCIRDDIRVEDRVDSPRSSVYNQCGKDLQGISVGWVDLYPYDLPEQWIDLGDAILPDGDYVLRVVADPENHLFESASKHNPWRESDRANESVLFFRVTSGSITALAG